MSNEFKDWLWDRVSDVLLENGALDKITNTIIKDWVDWRAIIEGTKDNISLKYEVWYDDNHDEDDDGWNYKIIF